jgi:pimeloyl-ACP methyl ester carboxylesterase
MDMGVYIGTKKLPILILIFALCLMAQNVRAQQGINKYGAIIESDQRLIKNGVLEKVVIHPQSEVGSRRRIIRKGILTHYDNAEATILVCHGFMCEKFDVGIFRRIFPRRRFNVMIFDFRAHGENPEGQCCTFGRDEALDVIAAAKFLKTHPAAKDKPIIAYGFSMGAVAAIEAQSRDSSLFEAMILDCPFDSSENVLKRGLENTKFNLFGYEFSVPCRSLLERYAFHPYVQSLVRSVLKTVAHMDPKNIAINICRIHPTQSIGRVTIPCFFIHCKNDEKISVEGIKSVFSRAAGPKMLWLTRGRCHFDSYFYNPEKYTERVRAFLNQVLNGEFQKGEKQEIIEDDDTENCIFCTRKRG